MIKKIYRFLLFLIIVRLSSATDNNADSVKTVGRVELKLRLQVRHNYETRLQGGYDKELRC